MAGAAESKVRMKLLIDTKGKRVLFAEADKECVDFLFHILSLPVATIIRLLSAQEMAGSLPNLYKSLDNLSDTYIQPDKHKDTYLKPAAPLSTSSVPLLALTGADAADAPTGMNVYKCGSCNNTNNFSDDPRTLCLSCRRPLSAKMVYVAPPVGGDMGIVKGVVTYMVMDDLVVNPMSTISSIALLNKFHVKDVGALEEKVVDLGIREGLKLLKASLQSKNVLTDVFC